MQNDMTRKIIFISTLISICFTGCKHSSKIDVTPHIVNQKADIFFREATGLLSYYDKDSTRKCINLLDSALEIDSLNPDYYGVKAKLLSELGLLDSALIVQRKADSKGAITGEYLFQLGLFQAAKGLTNEAHESFGRSNEYLNQILIHYPDSLGAFILQQAANALYHGEDSLFMNEVTGIRKRFPERLMEIEMTRRVKPHALIIQIQQIEENSFNDLISELDSISKKEALEVNK
jgi:tetratricopeptide (TPR) repeat protein